MDNFISYSSFMNGQDVLRDRFLSLIKSKPASQNSLSKEIGVTRPTIKRFLVDNLRVGFVSLCKIESYILKKENEK